MKFAVLALALASTPVFASSDAGKVTCEGVNPRVNKISFTLEVNEKGKAQAAATYQSLTDEGPNEPWNAEFNPRDISEASIGFQHLTFIFAHHNTVWKVIGDGDIFGGASDSDEKAPYNGVLFLQSGNGNSSISRFNITCRETN